jgi:hypothetical protein
MGLLLIFNHSSKKIADPAAAELALLISRMPPNCGYSRQQRQTRNLRTNHQDHDGEVLRQSWSMD